MNDSFQPVPGILRTAEDLQSLVAAFNEAEKVAGEFVLQHYKEQGERLLKMKDQVGHGEWSSFAEKNLSGSERQRCKYMRVATKWDTLVSNLPPGADLTLNVVQDIISDAEERERERRYLGREHEAKGDDTVSGWEPRMPTFSDEGEEEEDESPTPRDVWESTIHNPYWIDEAPDEDDAARAVADEFGVEPEDAWTLVEASEGDEGAQRQIATTYDKLSLPVLQQEEKAREYVTLQEWEEMHPDLKLHSLQGQFPDWVGELRDEGTAKFNSQGDNQNIEWALWSWNPVTGCLHNCPYCYARDIADRFYEQKFVPSLWPGRLKAPHNTPYPTEKIARETNPVRRMGLGNVFTCSMADLFGRWVPREWIEAVLREVRAAPQWNFLFLTKFPIRMAEFDFPENAWVGTTVDCQARVANAEKAFRKVKAGVKWLSCEPLIEPLRFKDLSAFDWVVLGGSSRSSQTPEWHPPLDWVIDLRQAAKASGCKWYMKTNLLDRECQYPFVEPEERQAPAELRYLPEVQG